MTDDVLDLARRAVETGPLCDPCLGRLVAERSFGLTNRERGRSLRVAAALADDRPVADLEPEEPCWVCEGESTEERAQEWAERAAYAVDEYDFETTISPDMEAARAYVTEEWAVAPDEVERGFERIESSIVQTGLDDWT